MSDFICDQIFRPKNYTKSPLPRASYENCTFEGCDFSNGYLDSQNFMECTFIDCNLSNANLTNTTFNEVDFKHCKMMGLKFEDCNDFLMNFSFVDCILNLTSFYELTLKNQCFTDCKLISVDFSKTILNNSKFENCDLEKAIFSGTSLIKADLSSSYNIVLDPEKNKLTNAHFSLEALPGLLVKHKIKVTI
ncbi:pentapeptide repeat-containing protein [Maribacter thermophilus]|uniref:pentapeptide repeat-containing protein n=1 Tax=Maribacter thermophilus TaxID=1197874 RepID=UPI0006410FAF|nr:pentapeptide repeat-containing protein [Maribacter thermophilus]